MVDTRTKNGGIGLGVAIGLGSVLAVLLASGGNDPHAGPDTDSKDGRVLQMSVEYFNQPRDNARLTYTYHGKHGPFAIIDKQFGTYHKYGSKTYGSGYRWTTEIKNYDGSPVVLTVVLPRPLSRNALHAPQEYPPGSIGLKCHLLDINPPNPPRGDTGFYGFKGGPGGVYNAEVLQVTCTYPNPKKG